MKGYWHFSAIAVVISMLTIIISKWFIAGFIIWLVGLHVKRRLGKIPILVSLTFFLIFYFYIPSINPSEIISQEAVTNQISGRLVGTITKTPQKIEFILQEQKSETKILVTFFKDEKNSLPKQGFENLNHGATCEVFGKIELPDRSTNPGQFNYRNYLLSQGITHQLVLNSPEDFRCTGSSPLNKIYEMRFAMIERVKTSVSPQTAAWLNALVLGDESLIDEKTIELFQRWSLSHLIAISGLNIGIIIAIIYFLLVKLNLFTKEKSQWLMILFLPCYALLAGGDPSVWRACLMAMLFIIVNKLKLKYSSTDTLSIVFLLLIIIDKYIVYSIGFQFSFLVTFGLLLSKKWFSQTKSPIFLVLNISFVSQMIILPIQVAYFFTFQPLSILLNVLVVPYFSLFVMPLMFSLFLLLPISDMFSHVIDTLFVHVHNLFISILEVIDGWFYYPWVIGSVSIVGSIVYFALFLYFMKKLQENKLSQAFKYGCSIVLLMVGLTVKPYFSPTGSVTMLDIGQGDAYVIELPYRKAVIFIDAGAKLTFKENKPTDKNYEQIIKPYLYSRGIAKVDAVFLSHEDIDHIGSIPFMIDDLKIDTVFISKYFKLEDQTKWEKEGTKLYVAESNQEIVVKGQSFHVLSPTLDKGTTNENSLVLYTELGGQKWLFTGDIGKETELDILTEYPKLSVDILKVSHHGSDTSTDTMFIDQIDPSYALLSVGAANTYGHPSSTVIETLKENRVFIFRTDLDGAVQFHFRKDQGTFTKYLP